MMDAIKVVLFFNSVFAVDVKDEPCFPDMDQSMSRELKNLSEVIASLSAGLLQRVEERGGNICGMRVHLMLEELGEVIEAMSDGDAVKTLHECADLGWVFVGTLISLGLWPWFGHAFDELNRANHSKIGRDGKPLKTPGGRIIKGPDFAMANMKKVLPERFWRRVCFQ
jgi:predicted HAD superfamily Cof-like phosphohydrolase